MSRDEPHAPQGRAKGLLFNHLERWALEEHGQQAWEEALGKMGSREQELFGGLILASSWQPIAAWNTIVRVFFGQQYSDPNEGMSLFCAHLGECELTTLVRLVLKLGSPEFMLKRTGFLWKRYFDSGTFTAEQEAPGHWRLWLTDDADENRTAGTLTCSNGPGPWLQRGLELSGTGGTVRHLRCRFDGHERCEFEARWSQ
ncbi:MAG: hypothetical protein KUG77_19890 [Nannocystaceae bacterium]|nr:hypothetical protein [Nannocystaceae bacterium]